ncbi:cadmium-sensing regulator, CadC [Amphibacillus marinus]|uniref:Cadmium-sensing regulator, CadC n=1 Tax=Amphibacillus marinus TaxID=872970 RepID=A0A1H8THC2_9BACI|nr:metalloregulator ArsR/SmtB family transcription factor [Amphibacillus marinus]SEO90297.1 cadmium-sensing regulator, CadC [Amphibacillus marinus]
MTQKVKQTYDTCEIFCYDEEKVSRVSSIVEEKNLSPIANIFKALSDETRLKIAYALVLEEELCVCDVANIIGASTATVSHHLRLLRNLGICTSRKDGKLVFYSLDDKHVKMLVTASINHREEVNSRV